MESSYEKGTFPQSIWKSFCFNPLFASIRNDFLLTRLSQLSSVIPVHLIKQNLKNVFLYEIYKTE